MTDAGGRHVLFLNWRDTGASGGRRLGGLPRAGGRRAGRPAATARRCSARPTEQPRPRRPRPQGVRIVRRGGRHTVYLFAALIYLAGALGFGPLVAPPARAGPDLIVDVCNGLPFLSRLYARRPVIALVHHVHREQWPVVFGPRVARIGWWIESRLAVRVYRRCRYVTVSESSRGELAELGVDPGRITVVHNGTPEVAGPPVPRTAAPEPAGARPARAAQAGRAGAAGDRAAGHRAARRWSSWWPARAGGRSRCAGSPPTSASSDRVRFAGFVAGGAQARAALRRRG